MRERDQLLELCLEQLTRLGHRNDPAWKDRLKQEIQEVISKNEVATFLQKRQECIDNRCCYQNENNSVIPYLLNICREFDPAKPPKYDYGEYPDIDIDYIDGVREYVKEDFAKAQFGKDYVCNICNYNTFGMRSALIDCARIFSLDHNEIKSITKKIKDKDEDGKLYTFDEAIEDNPDLKEYCERDKVHRDVADAAKRLMNRNRSLGQHASGLVISRVPIHEFIPLVRGKEGSPASAWIEGLHGTDLSTVGFVKFDFLGLDGNQKIATAAKLACQDKINALVELNRLLEAGQDLDGSPIRCASIVKDAIGEMTVCALPGLQEDGKPYPSWSDTSYLNDEEALKMANAGDLRMIFQFDGSPGIRHIAKKGGVTSFDDLVAYTALYRPGPMKLGYDNEYCLRKKGKPYEVHPLLANGPANLSFTYGVLCYQEQIMRMLNTVGDIPLGDCETVRKAISKKKIEKFEKVKSKFIERGQVVLGQPQKYLEHLWEQIEAFAGYGFNLSHAVGYTYLSSRMLWLKAHLPKQFFASMFTHTKAAGPDDYQKLKEYKREAEKHGVKMMPININKSKDHFTVHGEKVYYGFCKLKGVGEEPARRLQKLQPYDGFEDFLHRFGTDAKTVQAVIALKCFKETDPITLYTFYEAFKDFDKKETSRIKRFETTKAKLIEQIDAYKNQLNMLLSQDREYRKIEMLEAGMDPEIEDDGELFLRNEINLLERKLELCIANKEKKDQFAEFPTLAKFNPDQKLNEEFMQILSDPTGDKAEIEFYGYIWSHPLEKAPGYTGHNIEAFLSSNDPDGQIEVIIRDVTEKKGPNAIYYSIGVEDAAGYKRKVTVWQDDYERFAEELQKNKMVRLHVGAPKPPYPTFTLYQVPGGYRRRPRRENDHRVNLLG